jgi:hypothetical protein
VASGGSWDVARESFNVVLRSTGTTADYRTQSCPCSRGPSRIDSGLDPSAYRLLQVSIYAQVQSHGCCCLRHTPIYPYIHCVFVRPGTSAAIAFLCLSAFVCTTSFNLMFPSVVHILIYPVVRTERGPKASRHLLRHGSLLRPGTSAAIAYQSLSLKFSPHPTACCCMDFV